ncbi:MAG: alpha/beta hydrolase-fold protein [Janthinobacterium lividum]
MNRLFDRLRTRLAKTRRASAAPVIIRLSSLPANTPDGATLYLTGSGNGWNTDEPAYAFEAEADGGFVLRLPPGRGVLEYKICRGSWTTIETDYDNRAIPNRHYLFGQDGPEISIQVQNWEDLAGTIPPRPHSASPNVQILSAAFIIPQLKRARRVWLYLPPDYATSTRHYPVLYLQDGQNVFDEFTSYAGEWGVDETLDELHAQGQDYGSCLVVAVDNGGPRRLDEYSPWPNARSRRGGQGEHYAEFLVNTLKPYIDQHYRTLTGPEATGIGGSSMGGLLATYAALRYPAVFGRVAVFSPAYWFAGQSLLTFVAQHRPHPDARFYLLCGAQESPTMEPLLAAVRDALLAGGLPASQLSYQVRPDGQHAEWFWRREFAQAYQWFFHQ